MGNSSRWLRSLSYALFIWLLGTAGILVKHDTVFFVFGLFVWLWGYRRGVIAMLLTALVFLLTLFPYVTNGGEGILHHVFLYPSIQEPYGLIPLQWGLHTPLMIAAVLSAPALVRRRPVEEALLVCLLVWLVTTSGIGINYFLLPLLIGALDTRRHNGWMLALGLVVAYVEVNMLIPDHASLPLMRLAWGSLWGVCALWLINIVLPLIRVAARRRSAQRFINARRERGT